MNLALQQSEIHSFLSETAISSWRNPHSRMSGKQVYDAKVSPYLAFLTQARTELPALERLVLGAGGFTTDTSTTYLDAEGNAVKRKDLSEQADNMLHDYQLIQYDMTAGKGYLAETGFFDVG